MYYIQVKTSTLDTTPSTDPSSPRFKMIIPRDKSFKTHVNYNHDVWSIHNKYVRLKDEATMDLNMGGNNYGI